LKKDLNSFTGDGNIPRLKEMGTNNMNRQYGFSEMELKARKCKDLIYSTRKAIMDLHYKKVDVDELLEHYFRIKKPLLQEEYGQALKFAERAFEQACDMLSTAGRKEEREKSEMAGPAIEHRKGFDFDIIYNEVSELFNGKRTERPGKKDWKSVWEKDGVGDVIPRKEVFFEIEREPRIAVDGEEPDVIEIIEKETGPGTGKGPAPIKGNLAFEISEAELEGKEIERDAFVPEEREEWKKAGRVRSEDRKIQAWRRKVDEFFEDGEFTKALSTVNKILKEIPEDVELLNKKGTIHFERGEHERSLAVFDLSLRTDPKNVDTWVEKAYVLHHVGDIVNSFYCYEKALTLEPANINLLTSIGALYFEGEEFDKAHAYFQRAAEIDPDDADLWFYRGRAAEKQERWKEAAMCYDRVLFIDPFQRDAILGRDVCHRHIYG